MPCPESQKPTRQAGMFGSFHAWHEATCQHSQERLSWGCFLKLKVLNLAYISFLTRGLTFEQVINLWLHPVYYLIISHEKQKRLPFKHRKRKNCQHNPRLLIIEQRKADASQTRNLIKGKCVVHKDNFMCKPHENKTPSWFVCDTAAVQFHQEKLRDQSED